MGVTSFVYKTYTCKTCGFYVKIQVCFTLKTRNTIIFLFLIVHFHGYPSFWNCELRVFFIFYNSIIGIGDMSLTEYFFLDVVIYLFIFKQLRNSQSTRSPSDAHI
jgi:formate-dependent nitrite reductase membrane component NrfD